MVFTGTITAVQSRSKVWRYKVDNRTHTLLGYNLFFDGAVWDSAGVPQEVRTFCVAISALQQQKLHFHIGDEVQGAAWTKQYPKLEYADYYRTSSLKKLKAAAFRPDDTAQWREALMNDDFDYARPPCGPFTEEVPAQAVYDERGCRMLDAKLWRGRCHSCKWAAMGNVTIEYDFGVSQKHRFETFCYGPKCCPLYEMGKPRSVPEKRHGSVDDDGVLDDCITYHRSDFD
ncbi:MAG: hypothetical protein IJ228_02445 [Succinivibrio sp.]|nr:hypothetical protein [Succinivibrio sp.]